jgi:serine-type D-Ala-D-Ala carboxypeptidase (penicillin-binding protein 5/6)
MLMDRSWNQFMLTFSLHGLRAVVCKRSLPKLNRGAASVSALVVAAFTLSVPVAAQLPPVSNLCASHICVVADTGLTIDAHNVDASRAPASMVKMMLMLLVSEGLDKGTWTLDTKITASKHAEAMGGSQVYLKSGEIRTLDELLKAVAVGSANDAAMAVAEGLWRSEGAYLRRANQRAKELGMVDTQLHSVHGLPPDAGEETDRTTAQDMAILAGECVKHARIMKLVGQKELVFRPGDSTKFNTNKLLWRMKGCDGLKTGFTNAAGYCLTATAMRDGIRLIAVVMGCSSLKERFSVTQRVLEEGFAAIDKVPILSTEQYVDPPVAVRNCAVEEVHLIPMEAHAVVMKPGDRERLSYIVDQPRHIRAPKAAGTVLGEVRVELDGIVLATSPLALTQPLEAAGWRWKITRTVFGRLKTNPEPANP